MAQRSNLDPVNLRRNFEARVDRNGEGGCWLWLGSCTSGGYGQMRRGPHKVYVHRVAYELLVGPIPEGLTIDHLCRVRRCVNPAHLEPVTMRENSARALPYRRPAKSTRNGRKTHCPQGHPYSAENTYYNSKGYGRRCRTCNREKCRLYLARRAAA